MSNTVIKVENISKLYRLGEVGTGTISHDLNRWWAKMRGKEDPFAKVGQLNDRTQKAEKGEHVWALKDIDFEVKQGEVLGIIGKNGAGKSTLLKILSRITSPTTGSIKVKGRVASLLEVGTGFHPEMTGRENVYLNGTILGMTKREIDRKFEEIMDFAGCLKYADTPVKRYSSGMMVRLGFAVAAFLEPEILIVDEVLAVGDAEFQKKAIGKMQDISKGGGRTVLFVSHNMASIESLCNKGVLLNNGEISFIGSTLDCIEKYVSINQNQKLKVLTKSREGSGALQIENIRFLNYKNEEVEFPITGKPIIFEFQLKNNLFKPINALRLSIDIGINDEKSQRIGWFSSEVNPHFNEDIDKEGVIFLKLLKFPIVAGKYSLNIFLQYNGDVVDWIKEDYFFEVVEGDFYGSGKNIKVGQGKVLLDYDLNII